MFKKYDIGCLYLAFIPDSENEYRILYHVNSKLIDFENPKYMIDLASVEYMQSYNNYFVYAENRDKILLNKKQVLKIADENRDKFFIDLEEFRKSEDEKKLYYGYKESEY